MARKPADLRSAMQSSAKAALRPVSQAAVEVAAQPKANNYPENPHFRPGRARKSNVTGYFDPAVKRQLRLLAADRDTTIQALLAEALNDLFARYGKAEIAKAEDN
jgi:hypothetical protein